MFIRKVPKGIKYRMIENLFGMLNSRSSLSLNNNTITNNSRLKREFKINDNTTRFNDSLSFFGNTIACSYLSEETMINIPTILEYTENAPKDSGVKYLLRKGWRKIGTN